MLQVRQHSSWKGQLAVDERHQYQRRVNPKNESLNEPTTQCEWLRPDEEEEDEEMKMMKDEMMSFLLGWSYLTLMNEYDNEMTPTITMMISRKLSCRHLFGWLLSSSVLSHQWIGQ